MPADRQETAAWSGGAKCHRGTKAKQHALRYNLSPHERGAGRSCSKQKCLIGAGDPHKVIGKAGYADVYLRQAKKVFLKNKRPGWIS